MSEYFDRDFFKFFLGFLAIISVSLVIILTTRLYQEGRLKIVQKNNAPVSY